MNCPSCHDQMRTCADEEGQIWRHVENDDAWVRTWFCALCVCLVTERRYLQTDMPS